MISNYFTLAGLVREWTTFMPGCTIRDIYSPEKDELALELAVGDEVQTLRISVRPGFHFVYRAHRAGRPRSNVATLFEDAIGASIQSVEISPSDRILVFRLDGSRRFDAHLYGSRANVFLITESDGDERIDSAFKRSGRYEGERPPPAKELPDSDLRSALVQVESDVLLSRKLVGFLPRFAKVLVKETMFRAGLDFETAASLSDREVEHVTIAVESILQEVASPSPRLYRYAEGEIFSLSPLKHLGLEPERTFPSVDEGVRVAVRQRARATRLERTQAPLLKALDRVTSKARRKVFELQKAANTKSRADEYERWGHLLMANPGARVEGERLTVTDILGDGGEIAIPVVPRHTVIQNAERYYVKARKLRTERGMLAERLGEARNDLSTLEELVRQVALAEEAGAMDRILKTHADALRRFVGGRSDAAPDAAPFRRFIVSGGFEVWVGRNARENDRLTFDHASPHDLWFHARGTAGSHVVLRVPGRKTVVGREAKEETAAIAAWFSAARGSGLVPVIVTERKYVSKPKGSDPGAVRLHRETVLMVEPKLPSRGE